MHSGSGSRKAMQGGESSIRFGCKVECRTCWQPVEICCSCNERVNINACLSIVEISVFHDVSLQALWSKIRDSHPYVLIRTWLITSVLVSSFTLQLG